MSIINKKYYILPMLIGVIPNVLQGLIFIYYYFSGKPEAELLPSPFIIYLWFYQMYSLVTQLVLFPFGINIFRHQPGAMIAEVTPFGALLNCMVWVLCGLILNSIFRVKRHMGNL